MHLSSATLLSSLFLFLTIACTAPSATDPSSPSPSSVPTEQTNEATKEDTSQQLEEKQIDRWLQAHRDRPPLVRNFLEQMPKGADLHTHLTGAVYAETYLQWAHEQDLCALPQMGRIVPCPDRDQNPSSDALPMDSVLASSNLYQDMIDALSVRNLETSEETGREQFFVAFNRFQAIYEDRPLRKGDALAELVERAAAQNIQHTEIIYFDGNNVVDSVASTVSYTEDWQALRTQLLNAGLEEAVERGKSFLDRVEARADSLLGCSTSPSPPACNVSRRYRMYSVRTLPPVHVFAQLLYGVERARNDPRVRAVDLVAPEDHRIALRDYERHMQMLDFLRSTVNDSLELGLHAGELTQGLVPPNHLDDHVWQALNIAGAQRIGHGVDVGYENRTRKLLETMRNQEICVEICLTSNEIILGITEEEHPFPDFLAADVPVTLATDDEGISRIDLTHEYLRAATTYSLDYQTLKDLSRNSLRYSFLEGKSLWNSRAYVEYVGPCETADPSRRKLDSSCRSFLKANPKADAEWELERRFSEFETSFLRE